ncbi:MAG: hypothetical protein HYX39_13770 [Bacteroidetes bacterium]|nr:hypothetical protein [Bacteroidota bacterium]
MTTTAFNYKIITKFKDRISTVEVWDNGIFYIKLEDKVMVQLEDSMNCM